MDYNKLLFPFGRVRPIQDEMIKNVVKNLNLKKHMLIHAPTGIGKTVAVLSPALSLSIKEGLNIFFLTPKHTQHQIVIETLKKIKEKYSLNLIAADLIGKKWLCPIPGINELSSREFMDYCNDLRKEEKCPFYKNTRKKGELTKTAEETINEIKNISPVSSEKVCEICLKKELCPYEVSINIAKDAKIIVGDYYHFFHPRVRDTILHKIKKSPKELILIVDEGHNLGERIRDLLTFRLSSFTLKRAEGEAREFKFHDELEDIQWVHEAINDIINKKLKDKNEAFISKQELVKTIQEYSGRDIDDIITDFFYIAEKIRLKKKRSFVGSIANFLESWLKGDEGFARIIRKGITKGGYEFFEVKYRCLDPSVSSKIAINESYLTILMSGTLLPLEMYKDMLGFENADCLEFQSPFPKENRLSLIVPETTTKYSERNEKQYKEIAEYCNEIFNSTEINFAAFFPSYKLRDNVLRYIDKNKKIFLEKQGASKRIRLELLNEFKKQGGVLLGVSGASFGEGIDMPGKFLEGVLIIGVPLEKPDLETLALIDYYNKKFNKGWDFGYIFPAMTRALQAAGRCIRSEYDKGVIIFLDKRFLWKNYFKCIPRDWNLKITKMPGEWIKKFFK